MATAQTAITRKRFGLRLTMAKREAIEGYIYISPWILGFLIFTIGPMLASLFLALTDYKIVSAPRFIGLGNFVTMVNDPLFWKSLGNTLYYAAIFVPCNILGSLGAAMLLNRKIIGRAFFRAVYFLPSVTPTVAAAILWMWILNPQVGLLNYLLGFVGIKPGPGWLGTTLWSKPALIIMALWGAIGGGTMLIFLAGLQGVPRELLEAAEIDGAGNWPKFWRVTLPLLSPTLFFNLVLGLIGAFQQFTLAFVATSGGGQQRPYGGPLYSTMFYVLYLYEHSFDFWEMGYSAALAWVFFLIVLVLTYFQLRFARSWVYYEGSAEAGKW
jgi:multiple sugar transport system permease protein